MALAAEHMESKRRCNYRKFNSLDIVWEAILMKFIYTSDEDEKIIRHEKIMLEKYSDILDRYRIIFEQYNYSLKIGRRWTNFLKKEHSASRLPFKNGYECYIYCEVQKDGKEVHIESNDGKMATL